MDYLNIPVAFCVYMLKTQKIKQFRLFIYLKTICSGHFKLSDELIEKACTELGYKSVKTFHAHFRFLVQKKWITYNSISGNYRVIGFKQVANRLKVPSSKGALYYPEFSKNFTGFVAGAVISFYMIYRNHKERRSALLKRSARKNRLSVPYSLPHTYLSKILNISKTTARNYRQSAIDMGFIKVTKTLLPTGISSSEIFNYKKYATVNSNIVRSVNNNLCLQQADILISTIKLRNKRNLRFAFKKFGKNMHR